MDRKWVLVVLCVGGCMTGPVHTIGVNEYRIALHRGLGLKSPEGVRQKAFQDAHDYCDDNGQDARITQTDESQVVFRCVSRPTFADRMNHAADALVGQNVRVAVNLWGYPTQGQILGDTVLEWSVDRYASEVLPTTSSTSGEFGLIPFSGSTEGTEHVSVRGHCSIQLSTAADGTIKTAHWDGDERGCAAYARCGSKRLASSVLPYLQPNNGAVTLSSPLNT
jgi:hypothetical protein